MHPHIQTVYLAEKDSILFRGPSSLDVFTDYTAGTNLARFLSPEVRFITRVIIIFDQSVKHYLTQFADFESFKTSKVGRFHLKIG